LRSAPNDIAFASFQFDCVSIKAKKTKAVLPIGRTARIASQIEAMREDCCKAAGIITGQNPLDEAELEECARLDDALAKAHALLRSTLASIIMSRLRRRSRNEN